MVQAGEKIKRNGIWLLPLSVRKDLAEKRYGGHNKLPQAAFYDAPEPIIRKATFGNQAMNVWVPFQGPPKRVKNADKSRDKVFRLIDVMEYAQDNAANGPEEAIKEGGVFQEEVPEFFVNGKNAMPVSTVNELKGHRGRALLRVFNPTGRAKAAFTAERNKLHVTTVRADIHGATKSRVTTV